MGDWFAKQTIGLLAERAARHGDRGRPSSSRGDAGRSPIWPGDVDTVARGLVPSASRPATRSRSG